MIILLEQNICFTFLYLPFLLSTASLILLFCFVPYVPHDAHSFSLPFFILLCKNLKEPHKIRSCKKKSSERHFLPDAPCKFIILRRMMLHTTCVFAGPAFQKCCKNTCTVGFPHHSAAAWYAAVTAMQEMGLRVEWPSCLSSWLERYVIREESLVSSSALMWQFTRWLGGVSGAGQMCQQQLQRRSI